MQEAGEEEGTGIGHAHGSRRGGEGENHCYGAQLSGVHGSGGRGEEGGEGGGEGAPPHYVLRHQLCYV